MNVSDLADRVRDLQRTRGSRRILLGIAGEPGGGKSTVATALAAELGDAVVAPMDGFHLAAVELERLGRQDRKGAIDTFDAYGYLGLLRRLREGSDAVVYAPAYDRRIEESVGSCIPIPRDVPIVISEGNYLLADSEPWTTARSLFDEVWFVDTPQELRLGRLIARHVAFGKSQEAAVAWANGPDEVNAALVRAGRDRADLLVSIPS